MKRKIEFGIQNNGAPVVTKANEIPLHDLISIKRLIEVMITDRIEMFVKGELGSLRNMESRQ